MSNDKPKFNIGDEVWIASCDRFEKHVTCGDCLGKKKLTVILGDDSRVEIDCCGCEPGGYEPPRGYNIQYEQKACSHSGTITGVRSAPPWRSTNPWRPVLWEYDFDGRSGVSEALIFSSRDSADKQAETLLKEDLDDYNKRMRAKEKDHRKWSWNVTYHRRQINHAQKEIEYHAKKLGFAKEAVDKMKKQGLNAQ